MRQNVQSYIKKLNFGYKGDLRKKGVVYHNKFASLVDNHTILLKAGETEETVTAENIVIAVGGRPHFQNIPGSQECCISSDDVFALEKAPGKTLLVGASYISLECGGFLNALGYDTTILVRSILLRGFDQEMAEKIGEHMTRHGVKFVKESTPVEFSKTNDGKILAVYEHAKTKEITKETFDTVLLAIGRYADTGKLNLEKCGVKIDQSGKIIVNEKEQSSVGNIYSIGDCAQGRPELTPPAIMAGRLLARRLYNNATLNMDYTNIATTVFTPLEYGACGLAEEDALKKFGEGKFTVYHSTFTPLEYNYNLERNDSCYVKVIVSNSDDKVVGFHILAPNAGEITQGIGLAIKCGVTKEQLDNTVGIHPTIAEEYCGLTVVKGGGEDSQKEGC